MKNKNVRGPDQTQASDVRNGGEKSGEQAKDDREKRAIVLKVMGGALLAFAFVMQIREITQTGLENQRMQAAALDARAHIKALEYENLYYSVKASGTDNPEYLRLAAFNYYVGKTTVLVTSPGDKSQIQADVDELKKQADSVHDVSSFQTYMGSVNDLNDKSGSTELAGLSDADMLAKQNADFHYFLFLVGSGLVLLGEAVKWPRKNR
jgi:hypothetical protein